ncbi:MAG: hypothetical protein GX446_07810 [Chthonomonadales bacterium]|nr:hypothetical protein [Chthonomonadales bacterium]
MNCPVCPDTTLVIADRMGVEIDYCPKCRGIWLDRGELDKLIEKAAQAPVPPPYAPPVPERDRYDRDDYDRDPRLRRRKKARSFLEDLFDF